MHDSAFAIGSKFLELYGTDQTRLVLELGSLDVNGSLRTASPSSAAYVGLDMEPGKAVDIVIAQASLTHSLRLCGLGNFYLADGV